MQRNSGTLLIDNVNLFDSVSGGSLPDQAVLVEGTRISWIGPARHAPEIGEHRRWDCTGMTMLAGLMNCHVHLIGTGEEAASTGTVMTDSPSWGTAHAIVNARSTLESGTTSVRDCGSLDGLAIDVSRMVASGLVPGPRIQAAGRVITMTGGHGHWIGREADGPWSVAAAVRAELHAGADFIKIMATGGVLTKGVTPQQTALHLSELESAVREAHNAGKRITGHAIGVQGVKNAIHAGMDSVEHAFHLDDEAIELALERGTIIVPTLIAVERIVSNGDSLPEWIHVKATAESDASEESFRAALAAGVKIAAGTDAGTPYNPHSEMPGEIELMVRYGMSPASALMAATAVSAENFGVAEDLGTIEVGKIADILVVRGDPVADITALRDVALVLKDGAVVRARATDPGS